MIWLSACVLLLLLLFYALPLAVSYARYRRGGIGAEWRTADRSSIGHLPPADRGGDALVRIFSAPTVRWRGVVATHCWIVFKPAGAGRYTRYDYTAWGEPIRRDGFEPDGRWFGQAPDVAYAADGVLAEAMIPKIEAAVAAYRWRAVGDYRAWPGPNSNTFIAAIVDAVPGMRAALPSTAIGKDFPYDGRWLRRTPSGTGICLTLGGYVALTIGWMEGIELSLFGLTAGIDLRRPALKLAGLGRLGMRYHPIGLASKQKAGIRLEEKESRLSA